MDNGRREPSGEQLNREELYEALEYFKQSSEQHKAEAKEMRKVFLTTGVFVLALVVVVFFSMAWFASNKSVWGEGMTVNVQNEKLQLADYNIYYCSKNTSGSFVYNRGTSSSLPHIPMMDYDVALGLQNEKTSVIFRLPISRETAFSSSDSVIEVYVGRDANAAWHTVSQSGDSYMSSITNLKCATVSALDGVADDQNQTIYNTAMTELDKSSHTAQRYVNPSDPEGDYKQTLAFRVDNFTVHTRDVSGTTEYYTYVYLQMNYDKDLIEKFYEMDDGYADIGSTDYKTIFYRDTSKIAVSIKKK